MDRSKTEEKIDRPFTEIQGNNLVVNPNPGFNAYPMVNPYPGSNAYPMANPYPGFNAYPMANPYPGFNAYPMANPYPGSNAYPMANPFAGPNPYLVPNPEQNKKIHDYLLWSISNLCCSFVIIGIVAIILSLFVRRRRRQGEYQRAKTLSIITLVVNIVGTIVGIAVWGFLIYIIVITSVSVSQTSSRPG